MNNQVSNNEEIAKLLSVCKFFPDFPKAGVNFVDFFSLIRNPENTELILSICVNVINSFEQQRKIKITTIAGLESRGAILGAMIAQRLKLGFIPIRKRNKLPGEKFTVEYATEYSVDSIEVQKGGLSSNDSVLIVDDLLATGGTLNASIELIKLTGAEIAGLFCIFTVKVLDGIERLTLKDRYIHVTYI